MNPNASRSSLGEGALFLIINFIIIPNPKCEFVLEYLFNT